MKTIREKKKQENLVTLSALQYVIAEQMKNEMWER